jgi:hypothetical protein
MGEINLEVMKSILALLLQRHIGTEITLGAPDLRRVQACTKPEVTTVTGVTGQHNVS